MDITVRPIDTVEAAEQFGRLEQRIWMSSAEDIVPSHMLLTIAHNGGGVLGAYASDGPAETGGMVGLTMWFPGIDTPRTGHPAQPGPQLKICSHMAGVLPAWQGKRVGLMLKLAQREAILAQGMTEWVTWTYDPLFRTNAVFNLHRLGAVCNTYKVNFYGMMTDGLNAGLPSDRCQVDWWIRSEGVKERLGEGGKKKREWSIVNGQLSTVNGEAPLRAGTEEVVVLATREWKGGLREPVAGEIPLDGRSLAVPIPDDIAAIRQADASLSMTWRLFIREAFTQAFAAGYCAVDCVEVNGAGWHYLLEKQRDKEKGNEKPSNN